MKRSLARRSDLSKDFSQIILITLLSLGGIGIAGGSFFLRQSLNSANQSQTTNNTSRYQEVRQSWSNQSQIKHFPNQLPADAKDIHLVYSPGLKQGNSFFQLRLKLAPEKIKQSMTQYSAIAKNKYQGGDTNEHSNLPNGVPTTFFYTSESGEESFPTSYQILVLGANDRGNPGFKWNHGDSYGVAIDNANSEIIYWAEDW
ncbi:MAG: hypothetical protein KME60_20555 [Cyanomargarita calcarea GSE-NOS-MK-12-04C]|jgi:hypothetical protein|uniref:Uncharacterized protein n=1 Tax=Cyanomargarita calcarea GSE-NOS-MK-12-04C TaxID=2839659 RepID=A0A951QPK0_9CYAN|nr:hypothetical protein [Cyanomargarita calcarea GSE-NOS-MK-12-04C]